MKLYTSIILILFTSFLSAIFFILKDGKKLFEDIVLLEGFGTGQLYSINYERIFLDNFSYRFAFNHGMQTTGLNIFSSYNGLEVYSRWVPMIPFLDIGLKFQY